MAQDPSLGELTEFLFPPLPPAKPTTTSWPSLRSPPSTSVALPSLRPSLSLTDRSSPSAPRIHTRPETPPCPLRLPLRSCRLRRTRGSRLLAADCDPSPPRLECSDLNS